MARTTTCCLSRFCVATRSRPARSGKVSTLATVKAGSTRSMAVEGGRESPTSPCWQGQALTTASFMWSMTHGQRLPEFIVTYKKR